MMTHWTNTLLLFDIKMRVIALREETGMNYTLFDSFSIFS